MKSITEHLSQYALYHQDKRNIATHFIGIPMIVVAITSLLSRVHFSLFNVSLTPAILVAFLSALFYLRLHLVVGFIMCVILAAALYIGECVAALSFPEWLSYSVGLFVVGWVFQFVGHYFEGKKPAFLDDVVGLLIGPLFICVEVLFFLGWLSEWQEKIRKVCSECQVRE